MADPADKKGPLEPDELVAARLRTSLRGFDQLEVRALLNRAADRIRKLEAKIERLQDELDNVARRPARVADLDEESLTAALGEETARVLRSAREAAADIQATAETKSAELLRSAEAQAHSLRSEAEGLLTAEREKAEAAAAEILEKAKAAGRKELEKGRAEGRRLVAEARALRTRMLEDLAEKRRSGLAHLESLRAAREQLLGTFGSVEATVTRVTSELAQADAAAHTAAEEAVVDLGELEEQMAELEQLATQERVPAEQLVPSPAEGDALPGDGPPVEAVPGEDASTDDDQRPRFELHEEQPEPPVAVVPAREDEERVDEPEEDESERPGRRTSALRILRRATGLTKEPGDGEDVDAPDGFRKVEAAEPEDEGIRVLDPIDGEAEPEPPEHEVAEVEPAEPEPLHEVPADAAESMGPAVEEGATSEEDLHGLFDRIRAEREEATEWARDLLVSGGEEEAPVAEAATGDEQPEEQVPGAAEPGQEPEAEVPGEHGDRPAAFAARDEAVDDAEESVVRALKRALGDEQNEVLAVVRGAKGGVPTIDDVLPAPDDHRQVYADAVGSDLGRVAEAGASSGGGTGPGDVGDLASRMASGLVDPLRDRVASVLDDARGNVDGSVVDELELADRVSAVYRQWRRQRLDKAARETLRAAFAVGLQAAATGAGHPVEWTIDPSHPSCSPDCEDNALAGPITPGDPFPAGGTHPPAHAECRCLALPAAEPPPPRH